MTDNERKITERRVFIQTQANMNNNSHRAFIRHLGAPMEVKYMKLSNGDIHTFSHKILASHNYVAESGEFDNHGWYVDPMLNKRTIIAIKQEILDQIKEAK